MPQVFVLFGATKLSDEGESRNGEKKESLAPRDNNLTSMPMPISFD